MKKAINRIPSFLKNKYTIALLVFLGWMMFFDENDIFSQVKLYRKYKEMQASTEAYRSRIADLKRDRDALLADKETLERFARERYLMKKDNEDLFIMVKE